MANRIPTARQARERLAALGWIPRRSEYFHHLPPPAAEVWLDRAETTGSETDGWVVQPLDRQAQGPVQAEWLDATQDAGRQALFDGTVTPGDSDQDRFAWANRAQCRRGLRIRLGDDATDAQQPIRLALKRSHQQAIEAPVLVLDVARNTCCTLVETHEAGTEPLVQNLQLHVHLAEGAQLRHVRVLAPGAADQIAHQIHVQVGAGARYRQALIASGCRYHLQRTELQLDQRDGEARIGAALLAAGNGFDLQLEALHGAEKTRSDLQTVLLASGRARGVANVMTRMAQGVRNAWTLQHLSGIPIGNGQPKVVLRPHLEICHDEVEAYHGATWGALPQDALFYARQRGLDEQAARAMIVKGKLVALLTHSLDGDAELMEALALEPQLDRAIDTYLAASQPAKEGSA